MDQNDWSNFLIGFSMGGFLCLYIGLMCGITATRKVIRAEIRKLEKIRMLVEKRHGTIK